MDFAMIEILFIYQLARKPVQARCAALVVPQPVPRDTRQASLPGMPQFVNPAPLVQMVTRSMKTTEPDRIEADPAKKKITRIPNACEFAYKGRAGSRPACSCQEMPMTADCGEP